MALVNYSSSSDSGSEEEPPKPKVLKTSVGKRLPLPSAIRATTKDSLKTPVDDPSKHDGRIRSFEHERGNWATLVFIPVDLLAIDEVHAMIKDLFKETLDLMASDNVHISLTKTVVLRHHWIKPFVKSLEDSLFASERFPLDFQSVNVYTNEDRTRTFIGLTAGNLFFDKLHTLMLKMDNLMKDFRLSTFYENPSFHASVLWCVGDHEETLRSKLPQMNANLAEMRKLNPDDYRIRVDEISCKSGNMKFSFKLK